MPCLRTEPVASPGIRVTPTSDRRIPRAIYSSRWAAIFGSFAVSRRPPQGPTISRCKMQEDADINAAPFPVADAPDSLMREIAVLIVTALNLDVVPAEIDPDAPLYAEGLGLDSIDILEIALEVSKRYGFQIRADDDDNVRIFKSLRSLTNHVSANRTA